MLALAAAAFTVTPAEAAAVSGVIAQGAGPVTVTALRDRVVWSERAGGRPHRYRLMQSVAGGPARPVAGVPLRRGPFDVDLGVDRSGGILATYSRCARVHPSTPGLTVPLPRLDTAQGCQIVEFRFGRRGERLLLANRSHRSLYRPSRWGRLLAYAQRDWRWPTGSRRAVRIFVRDLGSGKTWRFRGTPPHRIRNWTRGGPGALAIDLRDDRLAYGWAEQALSCPAPLRAPLVPTWTEIWTAPARGGTPVRIDRLCDTPDVLQSVLGTAVLANGDILYGRNALPASGGALGALLRAEPDGTAATTVSAPIPFITSVAAGGGGLYATVKSRNSDVLGPRPSTTGR